MKKQHERYVRNEVGLSINRSKFDVSQGNTTAIDVGRLVPYYWQDLVPGDTVDLDVHAVLQLLNPLVTTMDRLYADIYYFAVPDRILWSNLKQFHGEATANAGYNQTERFVPCLSGGGSGVIGGQNSIGKGSVADFMGIPPGYDVSSSPAHAEGKINALPNRAYWRIVDEFFRDQNLQKPIIRNVNDANPFALTPIASNWRQRNATTGEAFEPDYTLNDDRNFNSKPFRVNKFHDYFTSCLPYAQKGAPIEIPWSNAQAPVEGQAYFQNTVSSAVNPGSPTFAAGPSNEKTLNDPLNSNEALNIIGQFVDMGKVSVATVNELRTAFQLQRLLERDARGGTRYTEMIAAHFRVTSPDARQQRPEYIGGKRVPLDVQPVPQSSASEEGSPQGFLRGYNHHSMSHRVGTYSATEHCHVIGVIAIRSYEKYQHGIERNFFRKRRYDYYLPVLHNIGEQPVKVRELYCYNSAGNDTFGFQGAWEEYRSRPHRTSGEMRSVHDSALPPAGRTSLDVFHYGGKFDNQPVLGEQWLAYDDKNVRRTMFATDEVMVYLDILTEAYATRPMQPYSVPGLIDHN